MVQLFFLKVFVTAFNSGGTVATDPNGYYEIGVSFGWSDSVVPSKANFKFTPASIAYTPISSSQTGNFTAMLIEDIDENGEVGISDLLIIANNWLKPGNLNTGNLNGDEIVNLTDLSKLAEYWMQ